MCGADCLFDLTDCASFGICGDGAIQGDAGEECDDTNLDAETCESLGHTYGGTLACSAGCAFDLSGCEGWCGDDTTQPGHGEECDGTDLSGETCATLGHMHGGNLTCDGSCRLDTGGCRMLSMGSAGESFTCGLTESGLPWCWGLNNTQQVGHMALTNGQTLVPLDVTSAVPLQQISSGKSHTCGVDMAGMVYCWGDNLKHQLGTQYTSSFNTISVTTIPYLQVAAGREHTCGVTGANQVRCWGDNAFGQLGYGVATGDSYTPVAVALAEPFVHVTSGAFHSCALSQTGAA